MRNFLIPCVLKNDERVLLLCSKGVNRKDAVAALPQFVPKNALEGAVIGTGYSSDDLRRLADELDDLKA